MSGKHPGIFHQTDTYTEEVIKCLKDTIKQKSGAFTSRHDGSKALVRSDETYITDIDDKERFWRARFNRRKKNLNYGFFADKAKPYQPLGKVYLESGELILHSLIDDLRCKIVRVPQRSSDKWAKPSRAKKSTPQQKSLTSERVIEKLDRYEASAGYAAIKQRLNEVQSMRLAVNASQGLSGFMIRRESASACVDKKDFMDMRAPSKDQWKIVRAVGKIMGAVGRTKDSPMPVLARAFRKKRPGSRLARNIGAELEEDREEKLMRWRTEKKRQYLHMKLQAINSILCALHNMKSKTLKQHMPLSHKAVLDLLRQDITMDQYGKPTSCRTNLIQDDTSVYSDGSIAGDTTESKPVSAASNMTAALSRKRMSSLAVGNSPRRLPRLAQFASKYSVKHSGTTAPKVETWEDLLAVGDRSKKPSALRSAGQGGNRYSTKQLGLRRKDGPATTTGSAEHLPQWSTIPAAEKAIHEQRRMSLKGNFTKRTAEDVLNDVRHDFTKLQKKLTKEAEDDLFKRRGEQYKLIQNKFATMNLAPVTTVGLEKMRADAYVLTRDWKDITSMPMPWFTELTEEVKGETALKDETVNSIFRKISRFQHEDGKTIPFGKEKLCMIIMSMPAHLLITASMIHALLFIIAKILDAPPELLEIWLSARKLSKVKRMETSATPWVPNYAPVGE